jgi:hypothetical protein
MPAEARKVCAGCGKTISKGVVQGCGNGLFRFFLSAWSCKKIERWEDACRKCRSKFDNWLRKNRDEFNNLFVQKEFDDQSVSSLDVLSDDTSELPIIEPTHSRAIHPTRIDSRHCTGSYQESSCISSVSRFVKKTRSLNPFLECALYVKKEITGHSK